MRCLVHTQIEEKQALPVSAAQSLVRARYGEGMHLGLLI